MDRNNLVVNVLCRCFVFVAELFLMGIINIICVNQAIASNYSLSISSSGAQNMDITANGGVAISVDDINVTTNCRYGYDFTISSSVDDNNLYLNGNSSNNASGAYFTPVDGFSTLDSDVNKWGYYYDSVSSAEPSSSSIFMPVPVLGDSNVIIIQLSTASSVDIDDDFEIYYGVSASSALNPGVYKMKTTSNNNDGTIVYTATIANRCSQYTVHFNPTSTSTGIPVSGTGTMNDQLICESISTPLASNTFTAPSGYYFAG